MRKIFNAIFTCCLVLVFPALGTTQVLVPDTINTLYFNNFENLFDASGEFKAPGGDLEVGDHFVGMLAVQHIDANGSTHFYQGDENQLTALFAFQIKALIEPSADPSGEPHIVLGPPAVTTFSNGADSFSTGLSGNEVVALYLQSGAGTTPLESDGSMADDVAKATDGDLWMKLAADPGDDGMYGTADDPSYLYSHTDGDFSGGTDKSFAALDPTVNNTGFLFVAINDINENEVGGFTLLTGWVSTNEIENNTAYATGTSPWAFVSNDPAQTLPRLPICCVDIEKEINVDGMWYDHDECVDAPVVPAPHSGEYRLIVTNCGETTLTNAVINDPTLGVMNVDIADLAPGETRTLASGDISELGYQEICDQAGEFPNTASIAADCAEGPVPSVSDEDSSCLVCEEEEQCRVTAGGNKDGLTIPCELKPNGAPDPATCADKGPDTWGGQAGAPPRTDGNWTHHHKPNNKDTFVFHSNDLFDITCSDPGPICEPSSAPSPDRQIDFSGIGRFTNKHGEYAALPDGDLCFRVHLEDLGEPGPGGRRNDIDPTACSHCPGTVIGNDPDCENCTDYYMIRIYDSPAFDPDTHDCTGNLIYFNGAPSYDVCNQVGDPLLDGYYVRAGNVQMHTDNNGGSVGNEEICYDGIDNDGDGLIDAADPDCYSTEISCNDGLDNDEDGLTDLADPDCQTCTPTADKEHGKTCSDGFDNDCDGLTDAADPDC
jgi:hypothetical protein